MICPTFRQPSMCIFDSREPRDMGSDTPRPRSKQTDKTTRASKSASEPPAAAATPRTLQTGNGLVRGVSSSLSTSSSSSSSAGGALFSVAKGSGASNFEEEVVLYEIAVGQAAQILRALYSRVNRIRLFEREKVPELAALHSNGILQSTKSTCRAKFGECHKILQDLHETKTSVRRGSIASSKIAEERVSMQQNRSYMSGAIGVLSDKVKEVENYVGYYRAKELCKNC